jgi:fatty-acyl-CoA synthase/long-chain acyl-CoA synthetase
MPPEDTPAASKAAPEADYLTLYTRQQPDKAAVIDDRPGSAPTSWSYRELEERSNRLASALLAQGVLPGQGVIWCGQNSPWIVAMTHASRKAGFVAVPLNYRLSPEEAAYVVDNSDAVCVWVDAEFAHLFAEIRDFIPKIENIVVFELEGRELPPGMTAAEELLELGSSAALPPPQIEARTMIYTSGTTGQPKGAVRTGTGDPEQRQAMFQLIGYRPDDVYITTGPLYHSGPGGFMGIAYLHGQTVVLQRKFDPEDWLRLVQTYQATSTFAAPTPIRRICSLPSEVKQKYDCSSMRVMIANAAPWPFALKQAYLADFPDDSLWEVYGSTELGVNMILAPADQLTRPGSCGKPAPLVDVKLVAEDGSEVHESNVPGEVFVRSRSVFDTYHKAREKYEAETRGDFHTVGDIAYRDADGFYYICDRKKDMIISGGMNIYPAELEAALEAHPRIYEAAVFGIPSEEWGELVHAEIVRTPGAELTVDDVTRFCREHLAGYKMPRSIAFAEELPKTGSGKVLKRQLRDPYWKDSGRTL